MLLDEAHHRRLTARTVGLSARTRVLAVPGLEGLALFRVQQRPEVLFAHVVQVICGAARHAAHH